MDQLILLLIPLPFAAFWLWMFWDMMNNEYLPEQSRTTWMVAFVFLNFFTAVYYYFNVYKK